MSIKKKDKPVTKETPKERPIPAPIHRWSLFGSSYSLHSI
jgi:hypothetical protein